MSRDSASLRVIQEPRGVTLNGISPVPMKIGVVDFSGIRVNEKGKSLRAFVLKNHRVQ